MTKVSYFFEGDYQQAAELYRAAVDREPDDERKWRNLGDAVWHAEGAEAARPIFEETVRLAELNSQINPDESGTLQSVVVAASSIEDVALFQETMESLLRVADEDPQSHYCIAVAFTRLNNPEMAKPHIQLALERGWPEVFIEADADLGSVYATM